MPLYSSIKMTTTEQPGIDFPFEFCALRYLLQWQGKEKALHANLQASAPDLLHVRRALRFFQVARNFAGLKKDTNAAVVRDKLVAVRSRTDLTPEGQVDQLAHDYRNAGFQFNLSAASKLLWLSSQKNVIYDSRAFEALKVGWGHAGQRQDYPAYCTTWRKVFEGSKAQILKAVRELPKARAFLPGATPPDEKLLQLVQQTWFLERVFDIHLWELGGET